jgi:enoyl-CoA hydratase/carnithine racemase
LDAILEDERIAQRRLFPSADFREGVAAFIGKRAAEFKGE